MLAVERSFAGIQQESATVPHVAVLPAAAAEPVLVVHETPAVPNEGSISSAGRRYDVVKRVTDVTVGSALLVALAPLMSAIAVAVRLSSPGPAIFKQKRLTAGGRIFTIYKFRTMQVDAESSTGPVWASYCDPRVTRLGRVLRVTRLDELPQLFNVLRGDMSLIGPRPERPEMAEQLSQEFPSFSRRLEVKAGITGLAQIATGYASSVKSYRRKLALDIKYVENRCLLLDLRIALKTVKVVLTGYGAR